MTILNIGRGTKTNREQIWFAEKSRHGTSELFCLSDFSLQKGSNIVKQYMEGRFGAVPYTISSFVHYLLDDNKHPCLNKRQGDA